MDSVEIVKAKVRTPSGVESYFNAFGLGRGAAQSADVLIGNTSTVTPSDVLAALKKNKGVYVVSRFIEDGEDVFCALANWQYFNDPDSTSVVGNYLYKRGNDWKVFQLIGNTADNTWVAPRYTIAPEVTEEMIAGFGFTKNQGTYIKPNSGIPKSDLSEEVQALLMAGGGSGGSEYIPVPGADGGYYIPSVSATGVLSWTPTKSDMESVTPVNIKGKDGKDGEPGLPGTDGKTPEKGVDYFTSEDKNEIISAVLARLPIYSGEVQ